LTNQVRDNDVGQMFDVGLHAPPLRADGPDHHVSNHHIT
jgi:hypothetical protein